MTNLNKQLKAALAAKRAAAAKVFYMFSQTENFGGEYGTDSRIPACPRFTMAVVETAFMEFKAAATAYDLLINQHIRTPQED